MVISLHSNAFNQSAKGAETLYWPTRKKGCRLAQCIQNELVKLGRTDRGIKPRDNLYLLRKTAAPCVIVEPFFIDNDSEYEWAIANIDKLALAISEGVNNYE